MKPLLEDFLGSAAKWQGEHNGISYELSWHGRSEYSPEGTWCWYITLRSQQFSTEDWLKLRLTREDKEFAGSWRRHWDYDSFPDLEAHGGWTFGEMNTYLGRDGKEYETIKVGCDYAHLWDRESGYYEGKQQIERDAKHSIDLFCQMFPGRRDRCDYCGIYDEPEGFYTARNGRRVHKSQEEKLRDGTWDGWLPEATAITQDKCDD